MKTSGGAFRRVLLADPCAYCGGPGGTVDHIDPRRAGGANRQENLTGACMRCNTRKHATSLLGFLGWLKCEPERREIERLQQRIHRLREPARLWREV